jgi:hypothetical protein
VSDQRHNILIIFDYQSFYGHLILLVGFQKSGLVKTAGVLTYFSYFLINSNISSREYLTFPLKSKAPFLDSNLTSKGTSQNLSHPQQ